MEINHIIQKVSDFTGVPAEDILGNRRTVHDGLILARFLVYSILRDIYKMTYVEIAKAVNRKGHNTILYAIRRINSDQDYDKFITYRNKIVESI